MKKKYEIALEEKKMSFDDLPARMKVKIKELQELHNKVSNISDEELGEEEREKVEGFKAEVESIDSEIAEKIMKIDLAKLQQQRERMKEVAANNSKLKGGGKKITDSSEGTVYNAGTQPVKMDSPLSTTAPATAPEPENESAPAPAPAPVVQMPKKVPVEPAPQPAPPVRENEQPIGQHMQDLKQENFLPNETQVQEFEEEFAKKAERKPKKMSTSLVIMGVGALLLTWGAVNFFKERK